MEFWKRTGCVLCNTNCGLEVKVENNRITRVRGDKKSPKSNGYCCRKGLKIAHYQHNADRVLYPQKRVGNSFVRVSWDEALIEIAEKLHTIIKQHGPRSLAWIDSTQGCHFGAIFIKALCNALGSKYRYHPLAQEYTGRWWAHGHTMGIQGIEFVPDHAGAEVVMFIGKNPMMSHFMPEARRELTRMAKDPEKFMAVVDPRNTETAKLADVHLALRPGTDALLLKSMITIILQEGWQNQAYIDKHVSGMEELQAKVTDFDVREALRVCELDYEQVRKVCRHFAAKRSCLFDDLGLLLNRHSTLSSYLIITLLSICGRIGVPGGNYFPGGLFPRSGSTVKSTSDTWRTVVTGVPAIQGLFPPNVMPEEIMSDHPDRLRAVLIQGANPLRSYADTTEYEKAYSRLDLLVTTEIAMTETAAMSHYVLPAASGYEVPDAGMIGFHYPQVYFQMRRPVVKPEGEQLEAGEIYTRLADKMGLIPKLPQSLYDAADSGSLKQYRDASIAYVMENPQNMGLIPFIAAKTLGKALGSAHLAILFAALQVRSSVLQQEAARAGFAAGPDQGLEMFKAIAEHPEAVLVGICHPQQTLNDLATPDKKIRLSHKIFADWMDEITPANEEKLLMLDDEFPLILMAGRHMDYNANTAMRDPAWNKGKRACTLAMNPQDSYAYGFVDGQMVKVSTQAGEEIIELEVSASARKGQVVMPHGFGLVYDGVKYGANVNRLTKNTHRDRIAGTPLHRYVPCRVEAA